jgi:tetratricopeptide (TPR) repeat protein
VIVDMAAADLRLRGGAVSAARSRLDDAVANAAYLPDELAATVHYLRGEVLRLSGEDEAALAALERASALDPTDIPTLLALAENLLAVGDVDRAVEVLDRVVETGAGQVPGDPGDQVPVRTVSGTALKRPVC